MKQIVYQENDQLNFKTRIVVPEYIDDFGIKGRKLERTLGELEWVNKYLNGIVSSIMPVIRYVRNHPDKHVHLVDVGCGTGDVLYTLDKMCRRFHGHFTLTGIDANRHILEFARKQHFKGGGAQFVLADVINQPELIPRGDVYMFNLFLHHFEMDEIRVLFDRLLAKKPDMLVINDLHRSKIAYGLFTILCKLKQISRITFHDGQLSITKGFNKIEMQKIGEMAPGYKYYLRWHWAFRWQLVLKKKFKI